ncbi:DUF3558 family protein [Rhodococcoides yunnanense]|uniref:DUF3558 family protein n=1 Tax=Rhodococcoides yunnanense TaxID=278209 RepID=UPI000933D079
MQGRGVAILAAIVLITGCGRGVDGTPLAGAPAEPWDPCSIPAQAVEATGLHLAPEGGGWGEGIVVEDWTRCVWEWKGRDSQHSVRALASQAHSVSDIRVDTQYADFSEMNVAGRAATQFHFSAYPPAKRCGIAFDTSAGVVILTISEEGKSTTSDSCQVLLRHASSLSDYIPPRAK